jgi:triacylglycerol lipase
MAAQPFQSILKKEAMVSSIVSILALMMIFSCCGATVFATEIDVTERVPSAHVILLHGMGRSRRSMSKMAGHLADRGYTVVNLDYSSTAADIETLSSGVVAEAVETCRSKNPEAPVHFVTHSLGGILVRHYLQTHALPPGSRVVMLSPPNRGSEVADLLKDFFLYRWIMGPAGQQLGTSADALPNRLGPVDVPVGIITGDHSLEPWFSSRVPGPDDGKVSVARARLPEMADFLVVHRSHGFIMNGPEVIEQTVHFLKHGMFKKEG